MTHAWNVIIAEHAGKYSYAYLDFFYSMHYEHVLQILHGSFHPVVERSWPLGKLQEQLINGLQELFRPLKGLQDIKCIYLEYFDTHEGNH